MIYATRRTEPDRTMATVRRQHKGLPRCTVVYPKSAAKRLVPRQVFGFLDARSTSVLDGKVAWYKGSGDGAFGSQKIIHTYSTRSSGGGVSGNDPLGPRGLDVVDFDGHRA